jgi:enoyl-[acyl-carrier protein] reductase I
MRPEDLAGKRALVFGVASEDSIAWAIAQELAAHGAQVTLGYQKRFLSRLMGLVKGHDWIEAWHECDVTKDESVEAFFSQAGGAFDMLVHCIAFAPADALGAEITETKAADFATALEVSAYSLVRLVKHAEPRLAEGGSVLALTYLGADRVVPGYRVMGTAKAALQELVRELAAVVGPRHGIRVNAISAGPIRTLAASGVPGFDTILDWMRHTAPLRRNVTQQDVARAALFLLSDLGSGVTGQTLYVDAGYSAMGVPPDLDKVTLPGQAGPTGAAAPGTKSAAKPILFGKAG